MQAAGPDPWPGGCECGGGATMNALAAGDIEAADLLALARLDDDGAPGRCGPPWSQPGRPEPDMIATVQEPADPRPPPQTSGRHGAAGRSPGHPPVTASRAEMIAAASGRARRQLTPALTGVG
jgi:hypothetical protein